MFELKPPINNVDTYFTLVNGKLCYTKGTDIGRTKLEKRCICTRNYYGDDCGIPIHIWKTEDNAKRLLKIIRRRHLPRRIILSFPVNHEFDLFETRMALQADVVDVFVIHESNYTNAGKQKPALFWSKFQNENWLQEYHQDMYM